MRWIYQHSNGGVCQLEIEVPSIPENHKICCQAVVMHPMSMHIRGRFREDKKSLGRASKVTYKGLDRADKPKVGKLAKEPLQEAPPASCIPLIRMQLVEFLDLGFSGPKPTAML